MHHKRRAQALSVVWVYGSLRRLRNCCAPVADPLRTPAQKPHLAIHRRSTA
jgi:hypothetical protein